MSDLQTPPEAAPAAAAPADDRAPAEALAEAPRIKLAQAVLAWQGVQTRAGALLAEEPQAGFGERVHALQAELVALVERDPDTALLILVTAATGEPRNYSVTHALLVAVVCELAARHLPALAPDRHLSLRCAALTMNLAMTALQDTLALQAEAPDAEQRAQIDGHGERAAASLSAAGVSDGLWLDAVAHHHDARPGPLAELPAAQQLARLIQRADIFAARLSPRSKRHALSATAAAQAAYLDERRRADEAGTAIIKATGIYPPGTYVRLVNGELAVVLRRGQRANQPLVASVQSRDGDVLAPPVVRHTTLRQHEVARGVAPHDVKVRLDLISVG